MLASRVLSRYLPVAEGDVSHSVYEHMRHGDAHHRDVEAGEVSDKEERQFNEPFRDHNVELEARLGEPDRSQMPTESAALLSPQAGPSAGRRGLSGSRLKPKWMDGRSRRLADEEEDVPESLLLEGDGANPLTRAPRATSEQARDRAEAQWRAAQEQGRLHQERNPKVAGQRSTPQKEQTRPTTAAQSNPRDNAMWLYTNAQNLDAFLMEVYKYYIDHGVYSVLLSRVLGLLTELFVFSFAIFLTTCVDYSLIPVSNSTFDILIPQCIHKAGLVKNLAIWLFVFYWLSTAFRYVLDIRRLWQMHDFFHHVLGIIDNDIQTVPWRRVVEGLVSIRDANIETADPSPQMRKYTKHNRPQQRLNAEIITNRLMRQDNYYVALYNKDILDFTLPLPFAGDRQFYSKSLEWCIDFCLTNFIFDEQRSIRPFCLNVKNRNALVETLRRRFRFAAVISVLMAPFNIIRHCTMYFFRYYTEFTRNPSQVGARTFTPFAEWKIREFNELDHLFERRLRQAYPFANDYLNQFPKDKTHQLCRFLSFVSGAIAAVLTIATLLDHELFLGFEITPGRTAVFWLTVTVGIFGVTRSAVPPDDSEVHLPEFHLKEVLMYTHYMPSHWKDNLHSNEIRTEFSALYQMKILIFSEEILSLIIAPWILWRNSGKRSERIVDFFREVTVHMEGIGYQCNFAVFDLKKRLDTEDPAKALALHEPDGLRDEYYGLKDNKMKFSVQNFVEYYSHSTHRPNGGRRAQHFNPPPHFPGLITSPRTDQRPTSRGGLAGRPTSMRRSPVADSRRVPPRKSPRLSAQQRRQLSNPSEMDEEMAESTHGVSESRLIERDSDLRDWLGSGNSNGKEPLESDTDADDGPDGKDVPGNNRGVLGLLYQFSKAQTERGGGVNM